MIANVRRKFRSESYTKSYIVSSHNAQGTPVPIPNTEVKLRSADDTWPATARDNRSELTLDKISKGVHL
jgi:hypothetical protein